MQMATSVLDLVGVLLIGLVGALAVTTIQSQPPPETVVLIADQAGLGEATSQTLVIAFSLAAAVVLLSKSIASSFLTRRVLIFLANRQALVSARLTRELMARPLTFVRLRSSQETAFALIAGAGAATSQILGQLVIAATEFALLLVLGTALLFLSPVIALGAIAFFAVIAFGLQRAMGRWATRVGEAAARADIASLDAIQEVLATYREITVSDRRRYYVSRIQALRWEAARVAADTQFIALFPKYMFEGALVLGGFALAGFLFATMTSVEAIGMLALFLAAGTRVMPSLLRLQGAALGLRGAAGLAGPTFDLARQLNNPKVSPEDVASPQMIRAGIDAGYADFTPRVVVADVSMTYAGAKRPALSHVDLVVEPGTSMGLVGRSGAGKTTLADLILGVLTPDSGMVTVGGYRPLETIGRWPGGIAYVPQEVSIANASIRSNVALGLPPEAIDDDLVREALDRAHLSQHLLENNLNLDTVLGPNGIQLSGGQRQRIGIARALYTRPRLIVLDEATSALDVETERDIGLMIEELDGEVTTIIVAHRLSTVRSLDLLAYVDDGRVLAIGDFDAIAKEVPAFRRQTAIVGLGSNVGIPPDGDVGSSQDT